MAPLSHTGPFILMSALLVLGLTNPGGRRKVMVSGLWLYISQIVTINEMERYG